MKCPHNEYLEKKVKNPKKSKSKFQSRSRYPIPNRSQSFDQIPILIPTKEQMSIPLGSTNDPEQLESLGKYFMCPHSTFFEVCIISRLRKELLQI
jgi:hypothetical protein